MKENDDLRQCAARYLAFDAHDTLTPDRFCADCGVVLTPPIVYLCTTCTLTRQRGESERK